MEYDLQMPVVSSKINLQELDAVAEYANRHGITISNLIRMLLVREVSAPKILTSNAAAEEENESEQSDNKPRGGTLLERIRANRNNKFLSKTKTS
jgi:hypothetical protein